MFDPNEPASPVTEFEPNGTCKEYRGRIKFEQCAKDFTAAYISSGQTYTEAVKFGILAAEEFCRQMEEREK